LTGQLAIAIVRALNIEPTYVVIIMLMSFQQVLDI